MTLTPAAALISSDLPPANWDRDTLRSISSLSFNDTEDRLQEALYECRKDPSFDNGEQVCLACRTMFMVFSHEYITSELEKRKHLLDFMLRLFNRAGNAVGSARQKMIAQSPGEQKKIRKIDEYLEHIQDRISLAELINTKSFDAFKEEIDRRRKVIVSNAAQPAASGTF